GAKVDEPLKARVDAALKKASVATIGSEIDRDGNLLVRTSSDDDQTRAADVVRGELGSSYVVALNQASTVPAWMQRLGAKPMFLGLDLRGGVYFLMQVARQAALTKRFEATAEDIRSLMRDNRIRYISVEPTAGGSVVAKLGAGQDVAQARRLIGRDMPTYQIDAEGETLSVRIPE